MTSRTFTALTTATLVALTVGGCGQSADGGSDRAATAQASTTEPSPQTTGLATPSSTPPEETSTAELVPGDGTFLTPEDAERSDLDSTAETAAMMLHSWDTATDTTQTAAAVRAKPLMTDAWAKDQVEPERNGNQAAWLEPGQHEAYSSPSVDPVDSVQASTDYGPDRAARTYTVSWAWTGRDGVTIDNDESKVVTIYLERHSGQWQVAGHVTES